MKNIFIAIILLAFAKANCFAQPSTYLKNSTQIQYSTNAINAGDLNIITSETTGFDMHIIDSNGSIIDHKQHGTGGLDLLQYSRRNSNNEIMMLGRTFFFDTSTYRAFVVITDTLGNLKRKFTFKNLTTYSNYVFNGIYSNGYYYFMGIQIDSTTGPSPSYTSLFLSKTDTMGNLIWNTVSFPQQSSCYIWHGGLEVSHDGLSILVGSTYLDSVQAVNPYNEYYSYLMLQIDTNGNFIQRIMLPDLLTFFVSSNTICQISKDSNKTYLVAGGKDLFFLDSTFNIIQHDTIFFNNIGGEFAYKNLTEVSYIIGGYKGFVKLYKGDTVFVRDFSQEAWGGLMKEVIPTPDGGYFLISGGLYIKMDCEGHYVNPTWCFPTTTTNVNTQKIDVSITNDINGWNLLFSSPTIQGLNFELYNSQGQLLNKQTIIQGISSYYFNHTMSARGLYFIKIFSQTQSTTLKALK